MAGPIGQRPAHFDIPSEPSEIVCVRERRRRSTPQYHFITRNPIAQSDEQTHAELPDDDAAIEKARMALSEAIRDATMERRLLDREIEIVNESGAMIAVVSCDGGTKH
jgi:hypothetical protein